MANRQYVGARYVPKFADPVEWNSALSYEALTIVTHLGNSFTSKKPVPAGVDIGNTEYWVNTGNYNEQLNDAIMSIKEANPKWKSVKDYMTSPDSETEDIGAAIRRAYQSGTKTLYIPGGNYTMSTDVGNIDITVVMDKEAYITGEASNAFHRSGYFRVANFVNQGRDGMIVNCTNNWDGEAGYVCSGLAITDDAHGNGHYEWALLSILNNYSNEGENVAIYGQANKKGKGGTWGACIEVTDEQPSNDSGQLIGEEISYACGGVLSGGRSRVVLHEALKNTDSETPTTIDNAILVSGDDSITVKKGIEFYNVKLETGIDLSSVEFVNDGKAIELGYKPIGFDNYSVFKGSDGDFYIRRDGYSFYVTTNGVGFGEPGQGIILTNILADTTTKQTLDTKLSGASNWVKVIKGGVDYWLPMFEA